MLPITSNKIKFLLALCILFCLPLASVEQGFWNETDHAGESIILEWYAYDAIDEATQELLMLTIPVYAKAMAPFQLKQLRAFQNLPYEEQIKKVAYQYYPEDFNEDNCLPFLEASLLSELQMEIETASKTAALDQKYLILAKDTEGTLLGFTHFCLKHEQLENGAELEPIMIDPIAQGKGLARKLIFSILKLRPDVKRIYLCTNAQNHKAHAVYKHLGFVECARIKSDEIAWKYGTGVIFEFLTSN